MNLFPSFFNSSELSQDQVHDETREVMESTFRDVEINGYSYTEHQLWDVLLYASAHRITIKAACDRLESAPSYNWIYTFIKSELLDLHDLDSLEALSNQALEAGFPKRLKKRAQKIAIDLVLIPYYGDKATPMVYRSQAKRSTTKFFCYASAYVIRKNKRVTLCFTFVRPQDSLLEVLLRLENRIWDLGIQIHRLYLDRAFGQVDILMYLQDQPYVSVVALPKRGEILKSLAQGKESYTTFYTMRNQALGEVTFPLWVACRYQKGKAGKHGAQHLLFAVLGNCRSSVLQIAEEYRHRFGIETSYRIMNEGRAKTTSRNWALRLLLVALAFVLSNLWVYLKWVLLLAARRIHAKPVHFTFNLFRSFIAKPIENRYGTLAVVKL